MEPSAVTATATVAWVDSTKLSGKAAVIVISSLSPSETSESSRLRLIFEGGESPSVIDREAAFTATPAAVTEPVIASASVSPDASSSVVDRVKVPEPDEPPAAISMPKVSSPSGIE